MDFKELYVRLKHILDIIDEDRYIQTAFLIDTVMFDDDELIIDDLFEFASDLHGCDETEEMIKEVADVLVDIYLNEIAKGNADAMLNLGALYYSGRGGVQDYHLACKYYEMAANLNCLQAIENLGYVYYYGRTGKVDYKKAYHYFVKGALCGSLQSLYKLADMYRNGYYVDQDEHLAGQLYCQCYEKMSSDDIASIGANICLRMGNVFFYGIGAAKNYQLALKFYQEAEYHFYNQIKKGDFFSKRGLEDVIAKQEEIREILKSQLPDYDWRKTN